MLPSLSPVELIIILVIVIIIFGAGKLADLGGALGRGIKEFRKATKDEDVDMQKAKREEEAKQQQS